MTRVRLKLVNRVTKRLADGTPRVHYYHRLARMKLAGEPGSDEFFASYADAERKLRDNRVLRTGSTLKTVIAKFKGSVEFTRLRASTQREYERLLASAENAYGDLPIGAFSDPRTRGEFLEWRDRIAAEGKLREAENRLTVLARVLAWGVDRGMYSVNPLAKWGRTYDSDRSDMIWEPSHVEAFAAVASDEMLLALYVALYTGQRQGDLLKLTWTNYVRGELQLRQSKGRRHVVVPCITLLRTMLDELKERGRTSTHILTAARGQPWKKRHFSSVFKATCDRAGIVGLTFHDLRGTAITTLADAGCTEMQIASITGHSLKSVHEILEKYWSRTATQSRAAMAKLENHLRTVAANQAANPSTKIGASRC